MASARAEFIGGVRTELPILAGAAPFGLIYGAVAIQAGLSPAAALAMSSIIFAGSAQFASAQLFGLATPGPVIVMTIFTVNLRHALYSASVAPYLTRLARRWRWLLGYLLTDEAYVVAITHYEQPGDSANRHWYFLGAGLSLWIAWQLSCASGIFLGTHLGEDLGLAFILPVTFIALVVPGLKDRPAMAAAMSAGVAALAAAGLPYRLGLIVGAGVGIAVGAGMETRALGRDRPVTEEPT